MNTVNLLLAGIFAVSVCMAQSGANGDTVMDVDGNAYHAVKIGTQVWTVENLRTTKYNDGSSIPLVKDSAAWGNLTAPGYCYYNNTADIDTIKKFGALYNWYVVDTKRLAPKGWHVPTDPEWSALTAFLGGEAVAGGKLKEAGTRHWITPNTGATNATGFSALPGGYRGYDGTFHYVRGYGGWWSSTASDTTFSWFRSMYYSNADVFRRDYYETYGFSVRCVRD